MEGWPKLVSIAGVAGLYLAVGLWIFRAVAVDPSASMPMPAAMGPLELGIASSDQDMVAFVVSRNARNLRSSPRAVLEAGQCYPMPQSLTLGEHMLGEGMLGAPVSLFSEDPILTFNAAVLATYWLGALAAAALVYHWTGHAGAAVVAGLLYGYHPLRFGDPMHPFVIANHWTVLALLFADRLFERRRWLDAVCLAACLSLQLLESLYTVLGMVLIGGVYAAHLLVAHRRHLPSPLELSIPMALAGLTAVVLYAPYLHTREVWGALSERQALLHFPHELAPGGKAFPGGVVLLLAGIAVAHRLLRREPLRAGFADPRLPLALAAFLVFWATVYFVPLPFTEMSLPSLWRFVAGWVPGMDAVRSGASLRTGLYMVLALLAGCGVAALGGRSRLVRAAVALFVAGLWLAETFVPALATRSFGQGTAMGARSVRPDESTVRLYGQIQGGAVLDLPLAGTGSIAGNLAQASEYLRLHAYHHQPVAACNNSFLAPIPLQMMAIASLLPERGWKLDAVAALGFRFIVAHADRVPRERRAAFLAAIERLQIERPGHAYLRPLGSDGTRSLYRIEGGSAVHSSFASLTFEADGVAPPPTQESATFVLRVRNGSSDTFVHPAPLQPTSMAVRWYSADGTPAGEESVRVLLPLALSPNDRQMVSFAARVPRGGQPLTATIAFAERPSEVLARSSLRPAS